MPQEFKVGDRGLYEAGRGESVRKAVVKIVKLRLRTCDAEVEEVVQQATRGPQFEVGDEVTISLANIKLIT